MEINKKIDKSLKVVAIIITMILTLSMLIIFNKYLTRFIVIPVELLKTGISFVTIKAISVLLSNIILIILLMKILYLYINKLLKLFINKKILKGILFSFLVITVLILLFYIKDNVHYLLRNSVLIICYILALVCAPIIILGNNILSDVKNKKIIISLVLLLFLYILNFNSLINYAEIVVQNLSTVPVHKLLESEETEELDLSYLNIYTQKMTKEGYLSMYDINQIIDIIDSKSMKIYINYKDSSDNININLTNKEDEKIAELKESLKSNFYKFNYEINENNEIVVNIERYVLEASSDL